MKDRSTYIEMIALGTIWCRNKATGLQTEGTEGEETFLKLHNKIMDEETDKKIKKFMRLVSELLSSVAVMDGQITLGSVDRVFPEPPLMKICDEAGIETWRFPAGERICLNFLNCTIYNNKKGKTEQLYPVVRKSLHA